MRVFNSISTLIVMFFVVAGFSQRIDGEARFGSSFKVEENLEQKNNVYANLVTGNSTQTQLKGAIKEVCQAKGCWMRVDLSNGEEVFVRFKDYGFFVPTDVAGNEVVMNGKAFIEEMSVEDQKHYAKDKGLMTTEIAKITAPKKTLRFEADGVLITEK
ncbi:DUF4920 domain-containing protein [Croceivirga radicis]|uniref:DUF4920 domain-containing protein n=1 Tax=Croceivirga radicis TaxID=1929488 RepID=A0A1V6LP90_9FLAO|nr:DUF4920 domain-containing protein [Croceivirga radicis]OQD42001.1 DUF4920 domain-containing protein [Croceivirga radicis]